MSHLENDPNDEFIRLLTTHQVQLRAVIAAGLGSVTDSEDVLQKTNLAIWRKAVEFDRSKSFLAWAIGIARFEVLAFIRDRQRDRIRFDPDIAELVMVSAEEKLPATIDRQEALRACLAELPEASRDAVSRKYFQDQTIQRISEDTGRSLDGVKSLLLRVRKLLAECVEKRLQTST